LCKALIRQIVVHSSILWKKNKISYFHNDKIQDSLLKLDYLLEEVEIFIEELGNQNQREIMLHLHEFILMFANMEPKIRFKIPFYYLNSWICYLNPIKPDKVELAFVRANELSSATMILDFKKRKQIAGLTIESLHNLPKTELALIFQEAILLDETIPYKLRKKN